LNESHRTIALMCGLVAVAAVIRIALIPRQTLWADEIFSLAIATGHSLEQSASQSRPELGDYFENPEPRSASYYRKYLENDHAATLARVTRAVLLSDTSPPLYYLLLHGWTLVFGTSDLALRMFSVLWSLAAIPLIFLIGHALNGSKAGLLACVIFAIAPQAVYYSTEGRMYSLVWFLIAVYAYAMFRLHDGVRWTWVLAAILTGSAGLLTHYFFMFPWLACTAWLLVEKGRAARWTPVLIGLAVALLVLPWYVNLPVSFTAWRVTSHWLYMRNSQWPRRTAFIHLLWSFFSIAGTWLGSRRIDHLGAVCVVAVAAMASVRRPRKVLNPQTALLWVWLMAVLLAPIAFDVVCGSFTSVTDRYALAGLPAAFVLFALCLLQMPVGAGVIAGFALAAIWAIGDRRVFLNPSRDSEPYRAVALRIDHQSPHPGLLVVHSIPSGVLGIARYLHSDIPLFSWVGQLHVRSVPHDIAEPTARTHRVLLVKIHQVGEPAPEDVWLLAHAWEVRTIKDENAEIEVFELTPAPQAAGCRRIFGAPEASYADSRK
jgi:uncharacterized membrane protein